jgi:hypothetical protein
VPLSVHAVSTANDLARSRSVVKRRIKKAREHKNCRNVK